MNLKDISEASAAFVSPDQFPENMAGISMLALLSPDHDLNKGEEVIIDVQVSDTTTQSRRAVYVGNFVVGADVGSIDIDDEGGVIVVKPETEALFIAHSDLSADTVTFDAFFEHQLLSWRRPGLAERKN